MSKPLDLRAYTKLAATPANDITKEQFLAYERVRMQGKVNMLDLQNVCPLTDLKPADIKSIQQNFRMLSNKFNENWKGGKRV